MACRPPPPTPTAPTPTRPLLRLGANVHAQRQDGRTALMSAALKGHDTVVDVLIREGADVCSPSGDGWTPLMLAAVGSHVGVVEALTAARAEVHAKRPNGWTALMYACLRGWTGPVEALLRAGAAVNDTDTSGYTALMLAAQRVCVCVRARALDLRTPCVSGCIDQCPVCRVDRVCVVYVLCAGGGGVEVRNFSQFVAIPQFSAIFPQLPFACHPRVLVGALCVPCAEVLLREAFGRFGYGTAVFPAISRNCSQLDLTLSDGNPPPPCQENYPADAHPSAHKSVLESANPRMDSECASGCTWSTARATARLRDGRPPE